MANYFPMITVIPLLTSFVVCVIIGFFLLPVLRRLHLGQSIRSCGPEAHKKKSGTPTMGGIMIIAAIVLTALYWCQASPQVIIALWLLVGHGIIGLIDDSLKVIFKRNLGLTSLQKIVMQCALAVFYLFQAGAGVPGFGQVWIPLVNINVNLGSFYYIFALLVLVGTTNAVNLTDGLDGLVSWVTVPVSLAFAYIACRENMLPLGIFAALITGACLGFLVYNHHPAKVFMGDTGSLALGGGLAALALLTHTELLLVLIGGIYVAEALSVIIQVTYFKATHGKRIFRMSPLHHHFELGGWKETKVVAVFTAVSVLLSVAGVLLYSIRYTF